MKHYTQIDNITLQVTCDDKEEQKIKKDELLPFITKNNVLKLVYPNYNKQERDIKIRYKRNTIATIRTAAFHTGKYNNGKPINKYYISISFKGLVRYVKRLDKLSSDLLWSIAAYMKSKDIVFTVTGLDICLDVECPFQNMLVICTLPYKRTDYYKLTEKQVFVTTTYIERISKKQLKRAAIRSYYYYKTRKEGLDVPITRFELKLNTKYFNTHGLQVDTIENTLNRYHTMYFKDVALKHSKIKEYNKFKLVRDKELEQMKLEKHRLYPDINYIESFLNRLFTMDESLLSVDMSDI